MGNQRLYVGFQLCGVQHPWFSCCSRVNRILWLFLPVLPTCLVCWIFQRVSIFWEPTSSNEEWIIIHHALSFFGWNNSGFKSSPEGLSLVQPMINDLVWESVLCWLPPLTYTISPLTYQCVTYRPVCPRLTPPKIPVLNLVSRRTLNRMLYGPVCFWKQENTRCH